MIRFVAGLAVGYVLGTRAGREKYEQIVAAGRKAQSHPAVTQAQEKAKSLLPGGTSSSTETSGTSSSTESSSAVLTDTPTVVVATTEPVPRAPRSRSKAAPATTIDPLA